MKMDAKTKKAYLFKDIADLLFELQYNKNGLYGKTMSYRLVTTNDFFQVTVFHHGQSNVWNIDSYEKFVKFKNKHFPD